MSEIIKYVQIENEEVEEKESFLGLFSLVGKEAVDVTQEILKVINEEGLCINICWNQCYDNASTTAVVLSGEHASIQQVNKKVLFIPCINQLPNLNWVQAFASVSISVRFFLEQ